MGRKNPKLKGADISGTKIKILSLGAKKLAKHLECAPPKGRVFQVQIKLPGKKCLNVQANSFATIGELKEKVANILGVDKQNWFIYIYLQNKDTFEILNCNARISEIDREQTLYFYPKVS